MKFTKLATFIFGLTFSHLAWGAQPAAVHHKVVIVGGGMAGLTVANELSKHNIPAVIIEGRDRLGGRVETHYFNPQKTSFFEKGGSTIDSDHKSTKALASEFGVQLVPMATSNLNIFNGHQQVEEEETGMGLVGIVNFLKDLEKKIARNPNDFQTHSNNHTSWKPLIGYLRDANVSAFGKELLKTAMEEHEGIVFDLFPVNQTAEYTKVFDSLISGKSDEGGDHTSVKANKGMTFFVEEIAHRLKSKNISIQLDHKLVGIHKAEGKYILTFNKGAPIQADYIIMSLPFSTLRDVKMDPALLPDISKEAIRNLSYGTNSKIGFEVRAPANFYKEINHYYNVKDSVRGWSDEKSYILFVSGQTGQNLTSDMASKIVNNEMVNLKIVLPNLTYGAPVVKNWVHDEFSKGSYSAISTTLPVALSAESKEYKGLRAYANPADNKHFIFAGEHTRADDTQGHIEGAVRSGLLAAKILKESVK